MITNLVPVRIDASSSDGAVRIIDTLLIDTACLPISHAHCPPRDGDVSVSGLSSLGGGGRSQVVSNFSLSSLVDANASHLTESILADAEVHGAVRSSKSFMGGRLDLLGDANLYQEIERQIRSQLSIALNKEKEDLISSGVSLCHRECPTPDGTVSSGCHRAQITVSASSGQENKMNSFSSRIVPIKLRLRQENIVVVDEFDYDINSSGLEGCDPFSLANSVVGDLKLPPELAPSIAASIVEQIYGVHVSDSLETFTFNPTLREVPSALVLDDAREGCSADFAQMVLNN
mmetsp:Transcript_51608/g.109748  ORF Transcript_51608/g.109748 Transcript_51608/m.109748 type:complete len:289 (-) Transcript_51608:98-964(-)